VLFFADVYSLGSAQAVFYRIDTSARVTPSVVPLQRDPHGHICGLTTANTHYDFLLDGEGNVLDFRQTPTNAPMPWLVIHPSSSGMANIALSSSPSFRLVVEGSADLGAWAAWRTYDPFAGIASWNDSIELAPHRFYRLRRSAQVQRTATAVPTVVNGFVVAITVTDGGAGYTSPPVVTISGGGGSGAVAVATVLNGAVDKVIVENAGSGYTSTPTVVVADPPSP